MPEGTEATVAGIPVRILDLSANGARVEHEERFPLTAPQLHLTAGGKSVSVPVRVARSEIVGRRDSRLVYRSGIHFTSVDADAEKIVASLIHGAKTPAMTAAPGRPSSPLVPVTTAEGSSLDDSWIRRVSILKEEEEDSMPFAQFRLTEAGWTKSYVATPAQPPDGFTIRREELDFNELQRTFETADPETRRMMQIALESKLGR